MTPAEAVDSLHDPIVSIFDSIDPISQEDWQLMADVIDEMGYTNHTGGKFRWTTIKKAAIKMGLY